MEEIHGRLLYVYLRCVHVLPVVVRYRVTPSDDCDHVVPTAHAYAHVPTALGAVTSHHCMMMRPPTARLACMTCVPSRPSFRDSNKQQQDNPAGIISIVCRARAWPGSVSSHHQANR